MKKLFLLLCIFVGSFAVQAQEDWTELSVMYDEVYHLATEISKESDKVKAHGNVITIVKSTGATSIQKKRDKSVPVEFYDYKLITSTGRQIPLDKVFTEKVLGKFKTVLNKVKQTLKEDNSKEIESILESL